MEKMANSQLLLFSWWFPLIFLLNQLVSKEARASFIIIIFHTKKQETKRRRIRSLALSQHDYLIEKIFFAPSVDDFVATGSLCNYASKVGDLFRISRLVNSWEKTESNWKKREERCRSCRAIWSCRRSCGVVGRRRIGRAACEVFPMARRFSPAPSTVRSSSGDSITECSSRSICSSVIPDPYLVCAPPASILSLPDSSAPQTTGSFISSPFASFLYCTLVPLQ